MCAHEIEHPFQAATSIGANNSFVYPITVTNFKRLDYGPADFDHRNVVALTYVYTNPKYFNSAPGALRHLANGWATTGILQFRSGDPLTVVSSAANNSGSGQQRDRAVQTGPAYGGARMTTIALTPEEVDGILARQDLGRAGRQVLDDFAAGASPDVGLT